jgi:hypothetical protein
MREDEDTQVKFANMIMQGLTIAQASQLLFLKCSEIAGKKIAEASDEQFEQIKESVGNGKTVVNPD